MNYSSSHTNRKRRADDNGISHMIEYTLVTGIIMFLFVVMLLLVHTNFVDSPVRLITYSAFTDIGNGLSTRIVDVYAISPQNGTVVSNFDLPDDIVGSSYMIEISAGTKGQTVDVSRDYIKTRIALAGIGASKKGVAGGNTTGAGINRVSYDSRGFS